MENRLLAEEEILEVWNPKLLTPTLEAQNAKTARIVRAEIGEWLQSEIQDGVIIGQAHINALKSGRDIKEGE